jgi:hypothetical protein
MKLGIDFHGVVDAHPEIYGPLTQALVEAGHEVHLITGRLESEVTPDLKELGLVWTHYFSITQYHLDLGEVEVWFDDNNEPWMESETWDRTKAEYCEKEGIDLMIDDSPAYASYFIGRTVFLLQKNPKRQELWMKLAGRI